MLVHDRQTGVTTRVSVASDGTQANGDATNPTISADGQYVTYYSSASNLVADGTASFQVFLQTGKPVSPPASLSPRTASKATTPPSGR